MAQKTAKNRKALRIVLTVIVSAVLLCTLIAGGTAIGLATPHTKHFTNISKVSDNMIGGQYIYHVNCNGVVSILKTDTVLSEDLENNGEQDLKVKATGIDIYKTDMSGIFISYPVIVYEYVSE